MMRYVLLSAFLLAGLLSSSCQSQSSVTVNEQNVKLEEGLYTKIATNKGDILLKLNMEKTPMTTANFVALAQGKHPGVKEEYQGKRFYDGLTFHRVIPNFMIQGGDPAGTGSGGPGYQFDNEIDTSLTHEKGVISMANAGPNTNGSQFFITVAPQPRLDGSYSVFGKVVKGQEVADSISKVKTADRNKPEEAVTMEKVTIHRIGKAAQNFDAPAVFQEQQEQKEKARQEEMERQEAALAKLKEGATKTESGLYYQVLQEGAGAKPENGQKVMMNYAGYLPDGTLFDTSIKSVAEEAGKVNPKRNYQPFAVTVGPQARVIPGWKEALSMMKVGDKWKIIVPPELGYGARGAGKVIPPNSWLVFEMEMLSIADPQGQNSGQ